MDESLSLALRPVQLGEPDHGRQAFANAYSTRELRQSWVGKWRARYDEHGPTDGDPWAFRGCYSLVKERALGIGAIPTSEEDEKSVRIANIDVKRKIDLLRMILGLSEVSVQGAGLLVRETASVVGVVRRKETVGVREVETPRCARSDGGGKESL